MADSDDPVATVLSTPELLETILLQLDERTLLLSQRVSRTFKANIDGSLKLQRKLFFQLDPIANVGMTVGLNPFLKSTSVPPCMNYWKTGDIAPCAPCIRFLKQSRKNGEEVIFRKHYRYLDGVGLQSEGSWARMFVCQSADRLIMPKFSVTVLEKGGWVGLDRAFHTWVELDGSKTLGELVDEVEEKRREAVALEGPPVYGPY